MKESALSVANYFVERSLEEHVCLRQLKLMKLVYIAHGFMLAMLDRSVFNKRFDKVEAWRYGPVIPSVYHSFKCSRDLPIKEKTVVAKSEDNIKFTYEEPMLSDENAIIVCDMVWKRYRDYDDSKLVNVLHAAGTPWDQCYVPNMNMPIPDSITRNYYSGFVKFLLDVAKQQKEN